MKDPATQAEYLSESAQLLAARRSLMKQADFVRHVATSCKLHQQVAQTEDHKV